MAFVLAPLVGAAEDNYVGPYEDALAKLKTDPTATFRIQDDWTIVELKDQRVIWSFTPKTHPAHPAFATRTVVKDQEGNWAIKTDLKCGAKKSECDKLYEEYQKLDNRVRREIRDSK